MINIKIIDNLLIVENKTKELFEWQHRTFFNLGLEFVVDNDNNNYNSTNKDEFQAIIKQVVEYLKEENLDYSTDENVNHIINNIENQNQEFNDAKKTDDKITLIDKVELFKRELKPYQELGLAHALKVKHGANFSVPGSGKTTMVYAYYNKLKLDNIVDKLFVVGPFSSFMPWEEEAELCFGRKFDTARLVGPKRQSYYLMSQQYEMFLCHYQTVANDLSLIIELCKLHRILLVVDESHNIKKFDGGTWSNALINIAPYAKRRIILSGTPMPNGYMDLWSQMTFLWPGKQLLGEKNFYKNRISDTDQQEKIKYDIRPFFFRVKKSDLKLPQPSVIKTIYELKPVQAQIYKALSIKLLTELKLQTNDRQKLKLWRKAKMVRLLQASSNPTLLAKFSEEFAIPPLTSDGTSLIELIEKYSQFEVPIKIEEATDLVKKLLKQGKKVLLWTTFIHNIKMLETLLKGVNFYSIHGAIPKDNSENEEFNREKQILEFKETNQPSLLIANPGACAESISLHKTCHDAIYLDRSFNCGQYIQSLDRIHRIGLEQNAKVNYHILIAKNTIDETIDRRLDEKQETMIRLLEEEIPVGTFDVEGYEMEPLESEEKLDFEATINDVKKFTSAPQN